MLRTSAARAGGGRHAVGPRRAKRRLRRPDVAPHDLPASLDTDASVVGIGPLSLSREMGERVRRPGSLWRQGGVATAPTRRGDPIVRRDGDHTLLP